MDLKEFGNSINKILNERLSSPFYGSLIVSWLIINWEIVYLTLFVDSKEIVGNKIDYIIENYSDKWHLIGYPLISTFLLICIIPFVTYGAYSLSLFFNDLRQKRKIKVEKSQVLTVEQSLLIRAEIQNQKIEFNNLLEDKNNEIKLLKLEIDSANKEITRDEVNINSINESDDDLEIEDVLLNKLNNKEFTLKFGYINSYIQKGYALPAGSETIDYDIVALLSAYNIIESERSTSIGKVYNFTEKGNVLLKYYYKLE